MSVTMTALVNRQKLCTVFEFDKSISLVIKFPGIKYISGLTHLPMAFFSCFYNGIENRNDVESNKSQKPRHQTRQTE